MSSLSNQPYKGTRDWYPQDKRVQNYIFNVWRETAESFGYEEYGTPLIEPIAVYAAKSGQELVNEQTYAFADRGDRSVAIRPEMTPSISRMVAARRQELAYPARLYSIANFMRYERPQRGREREFWQLNLDLFGAEGVLADAEIICYGAEMLKRFGATKDMFTIQINNRKLIDVMMREYLGLDEAGAHQMTKLFDRKNKITADEFRDQAISIFGKDAAPTSLMKIAQLLLAKGIEDMPSELSGHSAFEELRQLFDALKKSKVTNVDFDITLMRGLDYYTGTVFEFFDTDPENNRSLFGGGRYDGLVEFFGAEPLSAVGMAPGYTTTELFLRSHSLLPEFGSTTEAYILVLSDKLQDAASKLASDLRSEGVRVELDITGRKLDKQLKTALKKKIPSLVFVGHDEVEKEVYTFKDTVSGTEHHYSFARIVSAIKDRRRSGKDELDELFD